MKELKIRDSTKLVLLRILIVATILLLWELTIKYSLISIPYIPQPSKIFLNTTKNFNKFNIIKESLFTLRMFFVSIVATMITGTTVAIIFYKYNFLAKVVEPFFIMLSALPKVSIAPIILIILSYKTSAILVISILFSITNTIISLNLSFNKIRESYGKMIRFFNVKLINEIKYFVLPGSLIDIIGVLKVNIGICFTGVIIGEMQMGKKGLGFLIYYGSQLYNLELVFLIIFILATLSYITYMLIGYIETLLQRGALK